MLQKAWKVLYDSYKNLHSDKQGDFYSILYDLGIVVFNPTSWTRSLQVLEVEMASLIPNAERLTMGKFQQVSSDGKIGLVLIESIPGIALKSFSFGNLPSDFSPIKGIFYLLIILKCLNHLIHLSHWSNLMSIL